VLADLAYSGWDRSYLGAESEPYAIAVDAEMIERVAWGTGNAPPWNADAEGAARNRHGGLIAPQMLVWTLLNNTPTYRRYERWVMRDLPAGQAHLHTGDEYRFLEPIRPGDVLTLVCRIDSMESKQGRFGRLEFMNCVWTFTNQHGRLAATLVSKVATLFRDGSAKGSEPPRVPDEVLAGATFVHDWGTVGMKENIRWMAAVDDYASTHYDPTYAIAHGFPDERPLLAGPHGGGLMTAALVLWLGEGGWVAGFDHTQRYGIGVGDAYKVLGIARDAGTVDAWLLDDADRVRHTGTFHLATT
jgi:acyl dehydratase